MVVDLYGFVTAFTGNGDHKVTTARGAKKQFSAPRTGNIYRGNVVIQGAGLAALKARLVLLPFFRDTKNCITQNISLPLFVL